MIGACACACQVTIDDAAVSRVITFKAALTCFCAFNTQQQTGGTLSVFCLLSHGRKRDRGDMGTRFYNDVWLMFLSKAFYSAVMSLRWRAEKTIQQRHLKTERAGNNLFYCTFSKGNKVMFQEKNASYLLGLSSQM